jgi:putative aldouronate transport system substrate-binding protein
MNKKFPYNTSDLKPSRRDFLRLSGAGLAAAMMARYGIPPGLAQMMGDIPAELHPGSPNNPRGWTTTLPPIPDGLPADPPVTVTGSRRGPWEFADGDDIENSPFTRLNAAVTGINWKLAFNWTDNEGEVLQKYNLAIASNELPDFMETVPLQVYSELLDNDLLEDITDVYDEVAHPIWLKEAMSFSDGIAWRLAEVNGRKMGLPYIEQAAQNDKLTWIRQDWLDAVGMSVPTTIEELHAVASAFVEADMGQGGEGSTLGVIACGQLNTWYASLDPIFGAWGVMPTHWTPDDNGDLQYDSVRPEIKEVLATLRQWYAEGLLAQDFFTFAPWQTAGTHVGGNLGGIIFAPAFGAVYGLPDSVTNDPDARWTFGDIPMGPTGIKKKAWSNPVPETVYCFRKGFEHVDLVLKQIAWWAELMQNPSNRFHGWEGIDYFWRNDDGDLDPMGGTLDLNGFDSSKHIWGPPGTNGGSRTDPFFEANWIKYRRDVWANTPEDERDALMEAFQGGDPLSVLWDEANVFAVDHWEEDGIKNHFTTLPTRTMERAGTSLDGLEAETFINIINGQEPLDRFDSFVEEWHSGGGDRITDEVNEWWHGQM